MAHELACVDLPVRAGQGGRRRRYHRVDERARSVNESLGTLRGKGGGGQDGVAGLVEEDAVVEGEVRGEYGGG